MIIVDQKSNLIKYRCANVNLMFILSKIWVAKQIPVTKWKILY